MSGEAKDKTLCGQLRAALGEPDAASWRRYRELLTGPAGPAEVVELQALMPVMHKTAADVEADVATVARAKTLSQTIRRGRDLVGEVEQAAAEAAAKSAEAKAATDRLAAELAEVRGRGTALHERQQAGLAACDALKQLKASAPDLLADFATVERVELEK